MAHQRWLPSVVMARPRPVSSPVVGCFSRRTAASPPGPSTVLRNNWWSYWDDTQEVSVEQVEQLRARIVGRRGGETEPGLAIGLVDQSTGAAMGRS